MNDNGNKMMKEISFSKTYCIVNLLGLGCVFLINCFLVVYSVYVAIVAKNAKTVGLGFMAIVFLLAARSFFTDIVCFVRFFGLRINPLDDRLILSMGDKECHIPIGKDTNVMYCMFGWLITWKSGNSNNVLLLRKLLFSQAHWRELRSYFQSNANYIASKEDKKKLLKLLRINVHNPFKYIKWPA
jgi:hypothetical protein